MSIIFNLPVIVVSLGYFVDIFDLTLFNMVRRQSLIDIGIPESELVSKGLILLNAQMLGMLVGGIVWGQLGDRRGRLSTLFASIIMYSLANLANAFVYDFVTYLVLRFVAGIGLAGELGVGITLVSEILPQERRGLGTTMVATIGVLGAVMGGLFVEIFDWRTCYIIGGVMGLLLLVLRVRVHESPMFQSAHKQSGLKKGNFLLFFRTFDLFKRLNLCILVGVPIWFVAGILMPFTPELAKELGVTEPILASRSIAISYLGLAVGDFLSGVTSQLLKSRKKALILFQIVTLLLVIALFYSVTNQGQLYFYGLCFLIGVGAGFWALFVTIAAENFGTNLRATAATSIPNFVRASVFPMTLMLNGFQMFLSYTQATLSVGVIVFLIAIWAATQIKETFALSLDYYEHV
ncbi:MAG: MFS transporter [Bdellovibrionaceae bacterium]|nr:MFS transporter [Pseudobdellovibrionaceae bacterium]MDW8191212.1 MFS transporter [Pseudobdellovibrionaceae bacterium]